MMRFNRLPTLLAGFIFLTLGQLQTADGTNPAARYLWPEGIVPFVIDEDVPRPERVVAAIRHWVQKTPIRLVPRTTEPNYVRFVRQNNGGLCFSSIGMLGGEQKIKTDDRCSTGTLIHEIGHSVGLWHEQSRPDRDRYIRVLYENIHNKSARDFDRRLNPGDEMRPYDYASIMHYGSYADSTEGEAPTIETIPPGIPIGQRESLSAGDIDAVRRMYGQAPGATTIATHAAGLEIVVDGVRYTSPQTFPWKPGTVHTVQVLEDQTATGGTRYRFGRWSDASEDGPVRTITASPERTLYTANFVRETARSQVSASVRRGAAVRQP